jgi:hypothetical protein
VTPDLHHELPQYSFKWAVVGNQFQNFAQLARYLFRTLQPLDATLGTLFGDWLASIFMRAIDIRDTVGSKELHIRRVAPQYVLRNPFLQRCRDFGGIHFPSRLEGIGKLDYLICQTVVLLLVRGKSRVGVALHERFFSLEV